MDTRVAVVSNHDAYALECFEKAPNSRVSWWLMASYGYYLYNRSILSDELFDATGKWLKEHWEGVEHIHKHLITQDMLDAGSAYNLRDSDYPLRCKIAAEKLMFSV